MHLSALTPAKILSFFVLLLVQTLKHHCTELILLRLPALLILPTEHWLSYFFWVWHTHHIFRLNIRILFWFVTIRGLQSVQSPLALLYCQSPFLSSSQYCYKWLFIVYKSSVRIRKPKEKKKKGTHCQIWTKQQIRSSLKFSIKDCSLLSSSSKSYLA